MNRTAVSLLIALSFTMACPSFGGDKPPAEDQPTADRTSITDNQSAKDLQPKAENPLLVPSRAFVPPSQRGKIDPDLFSRVKTRAVRNPWVAVEQKIANGKFQDAVSILTQLISQNNNAAFAYGMRGYCRYMLGNLAGAVQDANDAIKRDRALWIAWNVQGRSLLELNNFPSAISSFTEAIRLKPKDAESYSLRSSCYLYTNQPTKAIEDASTAITLQPDNTSALWTRCQANMKVRRWDAARNDAQKMIAIDPNMPDGYFGLGVIYQETGKGYYSVPQLQMALACYRTWSRFVDADFSKQINALSNAIRDLAPAYNYGKSKSLFGRRGDRSVERSEPDFDVKQHLVMESVPLKLVPLDGKNTKDRWVITKTWPRGETLKVAFNGGPVEFHKLVADSASEWAKYANINFDFGYDPLRKTYRQWSERDKNYSAQIRITFDDDQGMYSGIGTDCANPAKFPPNGRSMNLGLQREPAARRRSDIIHEFGHALGFAHEHQHPAGACNNEYRWKDDPGYDVTWRLPDAKYPHEIYYLPDAKRRLPGVYTYLIGAPNNWIAKVVDTNLKDTPQSSAFKWSEVDRASIMHYAQDPFLFKNGKESPCCIPVEPRELSKKDKEGIAKAYGSRSSASPFRK